MEHSVSQGCGTNSHKPGGLKPQKCIFSHSLGGEKSRSRCQEGQIPAQVSREESSLASPAFGGCWQSLALLGVWQLNSDLCLSSCGPQLSQFMYFPALTPCSGDNVTEVSRELFYLDGFLTTSMWSQCQGRGTGFLNKGFPTPFLFLSESCLIFTIESTKALNL